MRWESSAPAPARTPAVRTAAAPPTRRAFLAGGTLVTGTMLVAGGTLLAGCSGAADEPDAAAASATPSEGGTGGGDRVLDQALATELALIDAYDRALAAGDDPLLRRIRQEHLAHLAALGGRAPTTPAALRGDGASTVDLTELIALEREAALAARRACGDAAEPTLIRTLAFIAASEASHGPALEGRR